MTRPTTSPQTYGDLLWHPRISYRKVSKALYDGDELTSPQIAEMTGVSLTSVKNSLAYFKQLGFVHVCRWEMPEDKPNSVFAVYKLGKGLNAPKPAPRYLEDYRAKKAEKEEAKKIAQQGVQAWKTLTECLVPKRSDEEIHEVNWRYLCWISPEAVKYVS